MDNSRKRLNEKRRNVQQQSRFGSGVNVSKSAKDIKEYLFLEWLKSFAQPRKSKFNFMDRTDDLEASRGIKVMKMALIIIQIVLTRGTKETSLVKRQPTTKNKETKGI